jgi:putative tricarboxylic transport membrane protein
VKTQRAADTAVGCFIALLGLLVLYASTMISLRGVHRLSPRTFPYAVGFLLLSCGIGLAFKSWRFRGEDVKLKWPDREGITIILVNLMSLAFYIVLMNLLGLPLSTFLYVTFSIWYLKRSKWVTAIVIGVIFGVVSYYVFIRLLTLSFPAGFLFGG